MSHFTTIQTQVRDLDALRAALGELGVTLLEKTKARGYAISLGIVVLLLVHWWRSRG